MLRYTLRTTLHSTKTHHGLVINARKTPSDKAWVHRIPLYGIPVFRATSASAKHVVEETIDEIRTKPPTTTRNITTSRGTKDHKAHLAEKTKYKTWREMMRQATPHSALRQNTIPLAKRDKVSIRDIKICRIFTNYGKHAE